MRQVITHTTKVLDKINSHCLLLFNRLHYRTWLLPSAWFNKGVFLVPKGTLIVDYNIILIDRKTTLLYECYKI